MTDNSLDKFNLKFWQPQLRLVAKLSSWVAFPVIIGAFLGRWLDKKFETEPWLFLTTVGLSFLISMFGLVFNTIKEYQKINLTEYPKNNLSTNIKENQTKTIEKSTQALDEKDQETNKETSSHNLKDKTTLDN